MKWTSKSLGSRFQHNFFYFLIRLRLVWVARFFIYFIVFYYTLVPSVRKRSSYYLRRRFPNSTSFGLWVHCYKLYSNFALLLLTRIIYGIQNSCELDADQDASSVFSNTLEKGEACIILSAHIGTWQMGILEIERFQRPINIVQFVDPGDNDKHYFEHDSQKKQLPIQVISPEGMQSSIKIATALQRKEVVCMTADRLVHESEKSIEMSFLNGKIALPLAPFIIASMVQCSLLITFSVLENNKIKGVWAEEIFIPKGIHKQPELLRPYVERFMVGLERMVELYPYQFFNFYNIWLEKNDK